jgi:ergothioneine biosynthesis protein EgtB
MAFLIANEAFVKYQHVRNFTAVLCQPLEPEDYVLQTMADVSPAKWHLAHTTWFFENFILNKFGGPYRPFHSQYNYLFNSYYNSVGVRHCRTKRGQLSRPTVKDVYEYRHYVDVHMEELLGRLDEAQMTEVMPLLELGIHHEQQHQELILTDIKYVFACNPLHPVYCPPKISSQHSTPERQWIHFNGGLYTIGHGGGEFGYDNEYPSHQVFLEPFQVASRLTTNGEYLEFMKDGGYKNPELWLSDGWDCVQREDWVAPLYWDNSDGAWFNMTLNGFLPVDLSAPVCHVSFYEANAYANWAGRRLLTEAEWEVAAVRQPMTGNFVESQCFHPAAVSLDAEQQLQQMFGDVWEWTASPYVGYPGYRPSKGALGEYNGKFMINQMVLRGGSCATSQNHIRPTYRNFFVPQARWQFSGIRLGDDI